MQLFDVSTVALERALAGSALRQQVLSNNIANANTPGFRRSDVDFKSALADALGDDEAAESVGQVTFGVDADASGATRFDGSNVDVDREMAALAENSLDYQAISTTLRARLRMLETAISGGGRF
jgi:flagellar basal-body rod protein FlgB